MYVLQDNIVLRALVTNYGRGKRSLARSLENVLHETHLGSTKCRSTGWSGRGLDREVIHRENVCVTIALTLC
jgi:hypothetical protein